MKIDVILTKDMPGLGKAGDVKKVTAGYYRNLLAPRGVAVALTAQSQERLEKERELIRRRAEKESAEARKAKEGIENLVLTFQLKPGARGVFGSVTKHRIWEELGKNNIAVPRDSIQLKNTLKGLGEYQVPLDLGHGITALLKVLVLAE